MSSTKMILLSPRELDDLVALHAQHPSANVALSVAEGGYTVIAALWDESGTLVRKPLA